MQTNRDLVYKEAQFYMLAVAVLLLTFSFAVIYYPSSDGGILFGKITRFLALIPIAFYVVYIFIQYQDTAEYKRKTEKGSINIYKQWGLLFLSLGVIVIGVEGLIRSAIGFGNLFNTPSFLWGLTVIAIGTSIPDLFVSIKASRKGKHVVSLANVLGSNTFDLLIAIPAGVLVAGSAIINFSLAAPMMGVLTLATIVLFTFLRTKMDINRKEAWMLLLLYLIFVTWMILETFGVTNLIL